MPGTRKPMTTPQSGSPAGDSEQLFFMLNCYDVWSATPRQGCEVGEAGGPATTPADAPAA